MGITEILVAFSTQVINRTGVGGIFSLMALESMIAPVPSEAVMPFAGFLWFDGRFTVWQILLSSTLGSLAGSLISYYLGAHYSEAFVKRWGKYLLLNEHHLEKTKQFFATYGDKTVFISRFIPVVRHFISIPAGTGRMNLQKFVVYTALGAGAWNMFLAGVGYQLQSRWQDIQKYTRVIDVVVVVAIVAAIGYFVWKRKNRRT